MEMHATVFGAAPLVKEPVMGSRCCVTPLDEATP